MEILSQIGVFIYHYLDFLWLPAAWFVAPKKHRWGTMIFVLTCIATLRTQVELLESTGFDYGFIPVFKGHVYDRGLLTWGAVIALFLLMAHFSPRTEGMIFFAAGLSIYILAFCLSLMVMAI